MPIKLPRKPVPVSECEVGEKFTTPYARKGKVLRKRKHEVDARILLTNDEVTLPRNYKVHPENQRVFLKQLYITNSSDGMSPRVHRSLDDIGIKPVKPAVLVAEYRLVRVYRASAALQLDAAENPKVEDPFDLNEDEKV